MCIKVLPLLFTAVTPPTQPEGVVETGTNPAAGIYVLIRMWVRGRMWVGVGGCVSHLLYG